MQGLSRRECLFTVNKLRISKQSKARGCENPEALSSITMFEVGAAMKIIKTKTLSRRKTEKAMNDYK